MSTTYKKQYNPELVKFVERITSLPSGPEKWGLAISAWLAKNERIDTPIGPVGAREYNRMQLDHNQMLRETQSNKFEEIKGGGLRMSLSIPEGAWQMVKLCDPMAFQGDNTKTNLKRFMQAFPQYVIGVD